MNSVHDQNQNPPMLGFLEAVVRCLRKYATFRGRATRAEYWWFSLFNTLLGMAVYAAFQHLMGTAAADEAVGFVQLALFLPALAVGVRRLHDINFRGWWMLLALTGVGIIPLIVFFCLPGKAAANRFGSREYGAQAGMTPETKPAQETKPAPEAKSEPEAPLTPDTPAAPETRQEPEPQPETPASSDGRRLVSLLLCLYFLAGLGLAHPLFTAKNAFGAESSSATASHPAGSKATPEAPSDGAPSSGQNVEQGLQNAFDDILSVLGEALGGMTRGVQQGARDMQTRLDGADGTRLIASGNDLASLTETRVLRAEQQEDRSWRIVLAVRNPQEFPLRLTGLTDRQQVLLLDQEDFVHEPRSVGERVVTVPERAAQKLEFLFPELDGSTPRTLRLYGMDFAVPQTAGAGNVSP